MKANKRTIIALALFCAAAFAASAQTRPRLAILPFTGDDPEAAETLPEFFSFDPAISGTFTAVTRMSAAIENLMKEQQFQRSGLTDSDTISELGRQMNAEYVLAGHITALGTSKLLLITIVHVERLQQIAGAYKEYSRIEETVGFLPEMAGRIAGAAKRDTSGLPGLAVLPFNAPAGVNERDAEVLAQMIASDIANSGKYAVFPRTSTIEKVMEEHNIERTGLTDAESIKQIGEAVNAKYVLSANFRALGADRYFSASILDIEHAAMLSGGGSFEKYQSVSDGLTLMPKIAGSLTGGAAAPSPAKAAQTAPGVPAGFVLVEGGTFMMGSSNGDSDEKPVHSVTVKSFSIGKYEVTQKEWVEVMGTTVRQQRDMADPSWPMRGEGDNYPMYCVSWNEVVEYCNRRSRKEGLTPAYRSSGGVITCDFSANGYRLPTEAEWDFAAKGGNKDLMEYTYSGSNSVDSVAWYDGNSGNTTHPVGTLAANSLGLYDMSGNVWEWCWDWYGSYPSGAQTDPVGASSGSHRVLRGGCWYYAAWGVRSACRAYCAPADGDSDSGFRLVRPWFPR